MISHIRIAYFGGFIHGFGTWIRCSSMAMAIAKKRRSRRQCTMRSTYTLLFALPFALQSIHLFESLLQYQYILVTAAHTCLYIYTSFFFFITPGLFRIDMGALLCCGNGPEYAFRDHYSAYPPMAMRTHVTATSMCIARDLHGLYVANDVSTRRLQSLD